MFYCAYFRKFYDLCIPVLLCRGIFIAFFLSINIWLHFVVGEILFSGSARPCNFHLIKDFPHFTSLLQ
jgi:hypothetical protein